MSITITLTDDQALEIVSQLAGKLKKNADPEVRLPPLKTRHERFQEKLDGLKKGDTFRTAVWVHEEGWSHVEWSGIAQYAARGRNFRGGEDAVRRRL